MSTFTYEQLLDAVRGGAVAIRSVGRLQPAGGVGDKVFPPTYVKDGRSQTKYAMEERIVDGRPVQTVLLDSVASQANRMEEALLEGWRRGELDFPVVSIDFSQQAGLEDLGVITSLQAPHRIADALLRDSKSAGGTQFRATATGKAAENARPNAATGMYLSCPTGLVFGVWDSTGPKGGLGAKFQRCLVSEIVGFGVQAGVKTESRIDPTGIERKSGKVYHRDENLDKDGFGEWTSEVKHAVMESGKPKEFSRKGKDDNAATSKIKGTPASINHGNIPPTIDHDAGGVTMAYALRTTVLSLAGLRRLRFVVDASGATITTERRDDAEATARAALAALGLCAVIYQDDNGYDLRSRSLLVAEGALRLELVARDGAVTPIELDRASASALLKAAESAAARHDLGWQREPESLVPTDKLATLIRESRKAVAQGVTEAS